MAQSKKAVVEGEWVNNKDERDFFTEEFILGPEVPNAAQARVIIQNVLLPGRMQGNKKYAGYKRFRTAQVVSFEDSSDTPEHSELNTLAMEAAAMDATPDRLESYRSPEAKTTALRQAITAEKKRRAKVKKSETVEDQGYVD